MIVLALYLAAFGAAWLAFGRRAIGPRPSVPLGDAAAVRPNRLASILSVAALFLIWASFTGSRLVPVHVPGPFVGDTAFAYVAQAPDGARFDGTARVTVYRGEKPADLPPGFVAAPAQRSTLIRLGPDAPAGARVVAIEGAPIAPDVARPVPGGSVTLTGKGTMNFTPDPGWQMEPIWLPAPEAVWTRFLRALDEGYQNTALWTHLGWSLLRVLAGFAAGTVVGVPLGYAMGLSGWVRGWFDPIVEFMRPVPPLALIPLVII